jgi:probable F420-dependent oxidoreductase
MDSTTVVGTARRSLGPVGAFVPASFTEPPSIDRQRDAVRRLEHAGYRTAWSNEPIGGKDVFTQVAILLAGTERITFGTGIANIWARLPEITNAASALLAQAYPDRFVLGLGVGYAQQAAVAGREFGRPLATMRDYLERMNAPVQPPAPEAPYARIIAANGPKLVALAGELADGVMPAAMPPGFTARVREELGPDKLLVVGLGVVTDRDAGRARAAARDTVASGLARSPAKAAVLADLGFTAAEVAEVSDRLVDSVAGHGSPDRIAGLVREHLDAGADHVALISSGPDTEAGLRQLETLASNFAGLT